MKRYELNPKVLVEMYNVVNDKNLSDKEKSDKLDILETQYVTIEKNDFEEEM
jgi:hypothetical protein